MKFEEKDTAIEIPSPVEPHRPFAKQLGEYQLVRRLGGGGVAEVYLAQKASPFGFVKRVVLKIVHRAHPEYDQLEQMLIDEARATACFAHPNLVSLLECAMVDDGIFLALEYVEGTDLHRVNTLLRERSEALPFELAAFILIEVLRGLHHAHATKDADGRSLEVIHRDVNPTNVLIARSGHVKLADFGVVRMRERLQNQTEPGLVKGKYAYLAPEAIAGERCTRTVDIYAAGTMLFELLSGRECFTGKTAYEVMWKIVNEGAPIERLAQDHVPDELRKIVERATQPAPERRFQTAEEMANALETWLIRNGKHATAWVLSVFFARNHLFPEDGHWSALTPLPTLRVDEEFEFEPTARSTVRAATEEVSGAAKVKSADTTSSVKASSSPQSQNAPSSSASPTRPAAPSSTAGPPRASVALSSAESSSPAAPTSPAESSSPAAPTSSTAQPSSSALPKELSSAVAKPWAGSLEHVPPREVLASLAATAATGSVEFRCGLIWKKLRFENGNPIAISSNMGLELIGEHLVKARKITRMDLDRALHAANTDGKPLTSKLLEMKLIDRDQLAVELGSNLAVRLQEVLEWSWGSFAFVPEESPAPAEIVPKLDLAALLDPSLAREGPNSEKLGVRPT